MAKDIIYIDAEDDITTIIGKVKSAKEQIIALVPPKRVGVLQSDVNLRLLARNAKKEHKKIVLITNDQTLTRLAAVAQIPVAKNLQSKPELASIPALAIDDDEVIDGSTIAVGEHEKTADKTTSKSSKANAKGKKKKSTSANDLDDINLEDDINPKQRGAKPSTVKKPKVPNFDSFRTKLFWAIGGGIALIALLVWMFVFAPAATITVTAKTDELPVSVNVTLSEDEATSVEKNILQASTVTLPESNQFATKSVEFSASGTKEVGEKAKGSMKVTRTTATNVPITIPAGTGFSSGEYTFVSTQAATIEGASIGAGGVIYPSQTVPVVAVKVGDAYNLSARSYTPSVPGVTAAGSAMTGGSSKQVKIVTQTDVNNAAQQLGELSEADAKKALLASVGNENVAIDDSYTVTKTDIVAKPAVGEEAPDGKGTVTIKATYSIKAVARAELTSFLKQKVNKEIESSKQPQKVYDYGADEAKVTEYTVLGGRHKARIITKAKVGPKLTAEEVKEQAKGKKAGEVREYLMTTDGVSDVQVKFSFFWVTKVPKNEDKIKVQFEVADSASSGNKKESNE